MARRHGQSVPAVSLFPFLAVLVCAMGSLILLLLIITRNVHSQSAKVSLRDEQPAEKVEVLPSTAVTPLNEPQVMTECVREELPVVILPEPIREWIGNSEPAEEPVIVGSSAPAFQVERDGDHQRFRNLLAQQQKQTEVQKALEHIQAERKQAEQKLQQKVMMDQALQSQLQKMEAEMLAVQQNYQTQLAENQKQKQAALEIENELQRGQQQLSELKDSELERQNKLEIVTYDGPTGVKRQPIFIECKAGEVIFHPEQVAISTRDLEEYPAQMNPLAYGVRALADYRGQKNQQSSVPYVLMIGRPEGIKEFYGCGQLLGANQIGFGYELISKDQELYFGKADPEARQILLAALEEARKQSPIPPSRYVRMNARAEEIKRVPQQVAPLRGSGERKGAGTGMPVALPLPALGEKSEAREGQLRNMAQGQFPPATPLARESVNTGTSQKVVQKSERDRNDSGSTRATLSEVNARTSAQSSGQKGNSAGVNQFAGTVPSPGAIRIEQKVVVRLYADGIQVGRQDFMPWPPGMTAESLEHLFLNLLQNEILSWDDPPEGIEWSPALQLLVGAGGNQHAFRIETVASELNVKTTTNYLLGRSPQEQSEIFE